jgi:PAS domain S-box-containing protein
VQSAPINIKGQQRGTVEVRYATEHRAEAEGPFLAEERELINAIGLRIGRWVEYRETQFEKDRQSSLLTHVIANAPVIIFSLDTHGVFTLAEGHGLEAMGLVAGESVGQSIVDLYGEQSNIVATVARVLDGETVVANFQKKGRSFTTVYRPSLDGAGKIVGVDAVALDITDLSEARRERDLVSEALQAAMDGVVIADPDGTIEWVNRAFTTLTGFPAEEAIGKNPRDLFKSGRHQEAFYSNLWQTITAGKVWQGRIINKRKDGTTYVEDESITPVLSPAKKIQHYIAIKRDVTELHEKEEAVREVNGRYNAIANGVADGIITANEDGAIVSVNPAVSTMSGYSADELIGRSLTTIIPARYRARHSEAFAAAASTGENRLEGKVVSFEGLRKDGSEFALELTVSMIKHGRSPIFAGILRDVSEQRLAQEALGARGREIEGLNRLFQAQLAERSSLIDSVLASCSTLASVANEVDNLAARAHSDEISSLSVRLSEIVRRMDDLMSSAHERDRAERGQWM